MHVDVETDLPGLELAPLAEHLAAHLPGGLHGPLRGRLLSGGRSNLTFLLHDDRRQMVLRRPPLGHVLETAHDMAREYRMLTALHPTAVPVPEPLVLAGPEIIGVPFYVMGFAGGRVLRDRADLEPWAGAPAHALAEQLAGTLADLHRLDPAAVGLADLGRPVGYLDRQLRRWGRQVAAGRATGTVAAGAEELDRLGERLSADVPAGGPGAVVHGDYRLDNVVVDADGRVEAVLDWEMATLGDPLTDLASAVVWWDGFAGLDSPVAAVPGDVPGFPSSEVLVSAYTAATGADLTRFAWYRAFAFYKIAAIFEGIAAREAQGLTVGEGFDRLGALIPELVARGHRALDEDTPAHG